MNFKLKSLVAAVVLAASVPAHAALENGITNNSSMSLIALDTVNNVSAVFDLGVNFADFTFLTNATANATNVASTGYSATSHAFDFTTGDWASSWSAFSAAAGNLANVKWAVIGSDNNGTGTAARGFISTYSGAATGMATTSVTTALGQMDTFYTAQTAANIETHSTAAAGASEAVVGNAAYTSMVNGFGTSKFFNAGNTVAVGNVGDQLFFAQYASGANGLAAASFATSALAGSYFSLGANGTLNYVAVAAVPEADTSAMMLAGLGLMGFIARRRTKA